LRFRNVEVSFEKDDRRPALIVDDADGVWLQGFKAQRAPGSQIDALFRRARKVSVSESPGLKVRNQEAAAAAGRN
jgi:hypothetical protein